MNNGKTTFTTGTSIGRVTIEESGNGNWIVRKGKKNIVARVWINPQMTYSAKGEHQGAVEMDNIIDIPTAARMAVES
jgi:hypothetical protein